MTNNSLTNIYGVSELTEYKHDFWSMYSISTCLECHVTKAAHLVRFVYICGKYL